jgi:hypothetical protein
MRLRVTRKGHNHGGKRLAVGDEFDGSEKLLAAFPDRLEVVEAPKRGRPKAEKAEPDADASNGE